MKKTDKMPGVILDRAAAIRKVYVSFCIVFVFVLSITTRSAAQQLNVKDLRTGDLLFQNLDCGPMCDAIEAVTAGWQGKSFSHVGMVERKGGSIYVWESMGPGVRSVFIDSFQKRSKHALVVARVRKRYEKLIPAAIRFLQQNEGAGYDEVFLYNNGKYYCSELIYDAFKYANNEKPFFPLYPMTFKQPGSTQYFPVWISYYQKLGKPVPEGEPGCNPGGLSRSSNLLVVGHL